MWDTFEAGSVAAISVAAGSVALGSLCPACSPSSPRKDAD